MPDRLMYAIGWLTAKTQIYTDLYILTIKKQTYEFILLNFSISA